MKLRPLNYLLDDDGETPVPFPVEREDGHLDVARMHEWAVRWDRQRLIATDDLPCGGYVSTIFLGINTSILDGPPVLFETMAFDADGGPAFQHRETTKRRALKTHAQVIAHVMAKLGQPSEGSG